MIYLSKNEIVIQWVMTALPQKPARSHLSLYPQHHQLRESQLAFAHHILFPVGPGRVTCLLLAPPSFESNGIVIWIFLKHQADKLHYLSFIPLSYFIYFFIFIYFCHTEQSHVLECWRYIQHLFFFQPSINCSHVCIFGQYHMLLCFWIWNNCQGARDKIAHTVTMLLDRQKLNSMLNSKLFGWQLHNCDTNVTEISKTCETSHLVENHN